MKDDDPWQMIRKLKAENRRLRKGRAVKLPDVIGVCLLFFLLTISLVTAFGLSGYLAMIEAFEKANHVPFFRP